METELYSTLEYSPGWYYKKWPGFYNVECYKILSEYSYHPEHFDPAVSMEEGVLEKREEGVEEMKGDQTPEEQTIEEPQEPPPTPIKKRRRVKIKNEEESV
jgi:hypothetical protein